MLLDVRERGLGDDHEVGALGDVLRVAVQAVIFGPYMKL
jgi:hypothetical protein